MRKSILLTIGATLLAMLAIIGGATQAVLRDGLVRLERAAMEEHLDRVRGVTEGELAGLESTVADWAVWDETYRFMSSRDPAYPRGNLSDDTLENLGLDFIAALDTRGSLVAARSLSPPEPAVAALITRYPSLLEGAAGPAILASEVWLVAAHPILRSDHVGPSRGTMILGRRLDGARLEALSARVRLQLRVLPAEALAADDPMRAALEHVSPDRPLALGWPEVDTTAASSLLPDLNGSLTIAVHVAAYSEMRRLALRGASLSMLWIALAGVSFGGVVLLFLERRVLSRVHSLSAQVLGIKTRERLSERVNLDGTDQLAYLAAAINGMLATVEESDRALRAEERRLQAFLDALPDLILLVSPDGLVRDLRIPPGWSVPGISDLPAGTPPSELERLFRFVRPEDRGRIAQAAIDAREQESPQLVELELELASSGERLLLEVRVAATPAGETVYLCRDVTAQRKSQEGERNELLFREIHHRVRNNLQMISSLLALQASSAEDERITEILAESQERIRSMALIHERLTPSGGAGETGFPAYIRDLIEHLARSYAGPSSTIRIATQISDVSLPAEAALPVGLVTSELLTNALRHAFPLERGGHIEVALTRREDGSVVLSVRDDGVGLPGSIDPEQASSLGFRIVTSLARQVQGRLEVERAGGTCVRLIMPARP